MKKDHKFFNKLSVRFILPFSVLIISQSLILLATICFGSTFNSLNSKTVETYQNKVQLRSNYLQYSMIDSWSNISSDYDFINEKIKSFISLNDTSIKDFVNDKNYQKDFLNEINDTLYSILRKNKVSESFMVLKSNDDENEGIYLRDYNPSVNSYKNNDVIIEISPTSIRNNYINNGFDIAKLYDTKFTNINYLFDEFNSNLNEELNSSEYKLYAYWLDSFMFHDFESITYIVPLIYQNSIYGILGTGVSKTYLKQELMHFRTNRNDVQNIAIVKKKSDEYTLVSTDYIENQLKQYTLWNYKKTKYDSMYTLNQNNKYWLTYYQLSLYSESSYRVDEQWFVVGITQKSKLFNDNDYIFYQILYAIILTSTIIICLEFIISIPITKPIKKLIKRLSSSGTNNQKTNIYEIDLLLEELNAYEEKVYEMPKKMNQLLSLTGLSVATFEFDNGKNEVLVSKDFYKIISQKEGASRITLDDFRRNIFFFSQKDYLQINDQTIYNNKTNKWLKYKLIENNKGFIGAIYDVTEQMNVTLKVQFERDHDILTGLYNRRGFYNKINSLDKNAFKNSCLMMFDIDNLKHLNDTYGHEAGDDYIIGFSQILSKIDTEHALLCHLSGDEFLAFLYNYDSFEKINEEINKFQEYAKTAKCNIMGQLIPVCFSCGIAFYNNEFDFDELRRKADFAMYEIKGNGKNGFNYFDPLAYNQKLINKETNARFVSMIKNKDIDYYFQPIVNLKTGEVHGYEALMRPLDNEFKSPLKTIEMAKNLNLLEDIEHISFFNALSKYCIEDSDKLLFINSLSSHILSENEFSDLKNDFNDKLSKIVIEVTEEENIDLEKLNKKLDYISKMNATFAIDDYGTGYNNILSILKYKPRYVKINSEFISSIDKDIAKQRLVKSLISYCSDNDILSIAECIETKEELQTVIKLGFDLGQGYFLGKPNSHILEIDEDVKKIIKQNASFKNE